MYIDDFVTKSALLGGTFNPVHLGHVRLAQAIGLALQLEQVELVPCAIPPHKGMSNVLPFELRVELLQAAVAEVNTNSNGVQLRVNPIEASLPPPSYTWNLLTALQPTPFIMGGEDFAQLASWHKGLSLPSLSSLIIVPRGQAGVKEFWNQVYTYWPDATPGSALGQQGEILQAILPKMHSCYFIPLPVLALSSSQIRKVYLQHQPINGFLQESVQNLLKHNESLVLETWRS